MCLAKVTDKAEKPRSWGYGWKVFYRTRAGYLYGQIYGPNGGNYRASDMCAQDRYTVGIKYKAVICDLGRYRSGFHVYRRRVDAETKCWTRGRVICRVKWSHQLAEGSQCRSDKGLCVVAKYMTILPEKGDAKPRKKGKR